MQSSLFLTRLPREVRFQILELLLKDKVFEVKYHPFGLKWNDDKSMNIAKTCRTCRDEAIAIFREQSTVEVDTPAVLALKGYTGMFNRNRLRRIRLVSGTKQDPDSDRGEITLGPQPVAPPQHPVPIIQVAPNFQPPAVHFPTIPAQPTRRPREEEPEIVLSNCMLHCLDVFFDLTHLQLQPSLSRKDTPKLRVRSSGEPAATLMRDVENQSSLRNECFQKLLEKELSLCRYLYILHKTLQGRPLVHDARIELVMPLLIQTEDPAAEPLEVKPFGTISIDIQERSLTWVYEDQVFHITDFGWSKEVKKAVLVANEDDEE